MQLHPSAGVQLDPKWVADFAANINGGRLVLKPAEAAKLIGCCRSSIYNLIAANQIPHTEGPSGVVIPLLDLLAWLSAGGIKDRAAIKPVKDGKAAKAAKAYRPGCAEDWR